MSTKGKAFLQLQLLLLLPLRFLHQPSRFPTKKSTLLGIRATILSNFNKTILIKTLRQPATTNLNIFRSQHLQFFVKVEKVRGMKLN